MKATRLILSLASAASLTFGIFGPPMARASDHGDGPTASADESADIGDLYSFLDPNDNDFVILIGTIHGFIVPGEGPNLGLFDPVVRYTFAIEDSGDAVADKFIDVRFTERVVQAGASGPSQDAIITFRGDVPNSFKGNKGKFIAPVTQATHAGTPPAQLLTDLANEKNPTPNIRFFAGMTDDPFFFDVSGFSNFVKAVLAGDPNAGDKLARGRDTFAGYNIMSIALRVPSSFLVGHKDSSPTTIGVNFATSRQTEHAAKGVKKGSGPFVQIDRIGIPGLAAVIIPFNDKNSFNASTPLDDAKGKFFADIAGTFTALGTDAAHLGILATVAGLPAHGPPVLKNERGTGDYLRLETNKSTKPNDGVGGPGSNANGFPNGRRIGDDVIDTIIFLATNEGITTGDHVDANDHAFNTVFPFLALPNTPRYDTDVDDGTRN